MAAPPPTKEQDAQFMSIWNEAFARHQELAGKLSDRATPHPTSPDSLLEEIDRQHAQFANFRDKAPVLRTVLKTALKPIELIGNLAAGGASMVRAAR